jgi:hypothetical protein
MDVNNIYMNKCQYFMSVLRKIFNIFKIKYIFIEFDIENN